LAFKSCENGMRSGALFAILERLKNLCINKDNMGVRTEPVLRHSSCPQIALSVHVDRWLFREERLKSVIRPYSDRDSEPYALTLLRTWPCENIQEARDNVAAAAKRMREGKEEIWVAEAEGKAVGFMSLEFTRVWGHRGEAFEEDAVGIDWFDVSPDYQGKGVGKELLLKAQERGRDRGLRLLFMHTSARNSVMINFASRNGFMFPKHLRDFWGEGTGDAFLMTKRL